MTGAELRDAIIRQLAKENAGGTIRWRKALGEIRVYPRTSHSQCNWDVRPTGSAPELSAVERLVDRVRLDHPLVDEPTDLPNTLQSPQPGK